jgi:single-stranded DNA-binding protein
MRKFETKDGQKVTKHEVVAENVRFLSKRPEQVGERDVRDHVEEPGHYEPDDTI